MLQEVPTKIFTVTLQASHWFWAVGAFQSTSTSYNVPLSDMVLVPWHFKVNHNPFQNLPSQGEGTANG